MRRLELAVEKIILCSRYLLVVLYLGLGVGLAIFAAKFLMTLGELAFGFTDLSKDQMILSMLVLIDWVLVGGLVVMVMLASYDNFVSRFDPGGGAEDLAWLGQLDHGSLKIKVASGIVAISAIHLLK
ncbi:MAG: YqhA family protein, partial [Candidatus Methylomirabilis sp.]|nr:YqhA family protein [Deltaproteobacteria bacterium]